MFLAWINDLVVMAYAILFLVVMLARNPLVLLLPMMIPLGIPMSAMVFGLPAHAINWLKLVIISHMLLALPGPFGMRIRNIRISVWILAQGLSVHGVRIVWTMAWCCVILPLLPGGFWIRNCT